MSANPNSFPRYRYRLWGINWLPLFSLAFAAVGLWVFLKYYDSNRAEELLALKSKAAIQVIGWLVLSFSISRGWFKFRIPFYCIWSVAVLYEIGQSVYRHDGFRFILSLILGALFYTAYYWIESCLEQAAVNPRLQWFSGKLSSVPHVHATVKLGDQEPVKVLVRLVDKAGAFVLFEDSTVATSSAEGAQKAPEKFQLKQRFLVKIKFKTEEIEVKGRPVATLEWEQSGLGLQFSFEDLYHQSKYTSLVQQIKGEGLA